MTTTSAELEARLGLFVEHHVLKGERLDLLSLTVSLDVSDDPPLGNIDAAPLPSFDGFQTIERIGRGGMGEVFKLRDLKLDRVVAAKVLRRDGWNARIHSFLSEAKALALFSGTVESFRSMSAASTATHRSSSWNSSTASSSGASARRSNTRNAPEF